MSTTIRRVYVSYPAIKRVIYTTAGVSNEAKAFVINALDWIFGADTERIDSDVFAAVMAEFRNALRESDWLDAIQREVSRRMPAPMLDVTIIFR